MNQNKIITEVLEIKRKVTIVENKINKKNEYDDAIENIQEQKNYLQEKLETIEKSIRLLDYKLHHIQTETEKREVPKTVDKVVEENVCEYNNKGFCKMRNKCVKFHATEIFM